MNRAYAAGYAWSRDVPDATTRTWTFREATITLPSGAVKELKHGGYHCLLAKWDDVQSAASTETPQVSAENIAKKPVTPPLAEQIAGMMAMQEAGNG